VSKGANLEMRNVDGYCPVLLAAREGKTACLQYLIDIGCKIHVENYNKDTPVALAAFHGHTPVLELLLSNGCSWDVKNAEGTTPVMFAATDGHYDCLSTLLRYKPNLNQKDSNGITAVMHAAKMGHYDCCDLLARNGADLHIRCRDGKTAAHLATYHADFAILEMLLRHGANAYVEDNEGNTPLKLYAAQENPHVMILKTMILGTAPKYAPLTRNSVSSHHHGHHEGHHHHHHHHHHSADAEAPVSRPSHTAHAWPAPSVHVPTMPHHPSVVQAPVRASDGGQSLLQALQATPAYAAAYAAAVAAASSGTPQGQTHSIYAPMQGSPSQSHAPHYANHQSLSTGYFPNDDAQSSSASLHPSLLGSLFPSAAAAAGHMPTFGSDSAAPRQTPLSGVIPISIPKVIPKNLPSMVLKPGGGTPMTR